MSLPSPTFQTGGLFTASDANGIVEAILARLESDGFNVTDQSGSQTILSHNVAADKDEILRLDSYIFIQSAEGVTQFDLVCDFTGPMDSDTEILIDSHPNQTGFVSSPSYTIKAKRGTVVTLSTIIVGDAVYDVGGSLLVLKSIA